MAGSYGVYGRNRLAWRNYSEAASRHTYRHGRQVSGSRSADRNLFVDDIELCGWPDLPLRPTTIMRKAYWRRSRSDGRLWPKSCSIRELRGRAPLRQGGARALAPRGSPNLLHSQFGEDASNCRMSPLNQRAGALVVRKIVTRPAAAAFWGRWRKAGLRRGSPMCARGP